MNSTPETQVVSTTLEQLDSRTLDRRVQAVVDRLSDCTKFFYTRFPQCPKKPAVCRLNEIDVGFTAIAICDLFGVDPDDDLVSLAVGRILTTAHNQDA